MKNVSSKISKIRRSIGSSKYFSFIPNTYQQAAFMSRAPHDRRMIDITKLPLADQLKAAGKDITKYLGGGIEMLKNKYCLNCRHAEWCQKTGTYDMDDCEDWSVDALTTIAAELKRLNRLVAYVIRRHLDRDYREEVDKIMEEE